MSNMLSDAEKIRSVNLMLRERPGMVLAFIQKSDDAKVRLYDLFQNESLDLSDSEMWQGNEEKIVEEYLRKASVPTHLKGYKFLTRAIVRAVENPFMACRGSGLISEIANEANTTRNIVSLAITNAVIKAYDGKEESEECRRDWENIFPKNLHSMKPGNLEFIAIMADRIREAYKI